MANKGKSEENQNLKEKIKTFFRISKDPKNVPVTYQRPTTKEFVFNAEILRDIGPESPANNRIRTIKEFSDIVLKKKLEENAIEALWSSIQDLLCDKAVPDNRKTALHFLQNLLEGQLQNLGILRGHFFNVIRGLTLQENLSERFELFKILSENGRSLTEFEEDAGPFLLQWMPEISNTDKQSEFLTLLLNMIKFNAAYLDEDIVSGFVKQTCIIASQARSDSDTMLCLEVLDAVICYSYLPTDCLQHFVASLCNLVNIPKYCEESWKLMRKLLGTHLGHSSLFTLCLMLQDRRQPVDHNLMRGAVFYIGMALWGFRKVTSLKHTPAAVLPSFLQVLSCGSPIVAHEIILSVQRLVKKYGKDLTNSAWDLILDILETILKQIETTYTQPFDPRMSVDLHEILSSIEILHEQGQFAGTVDRFFKIIEMCAAKRPETSVARLIQHQAQTIHPGKENWIACLYQLLDKYFRQDKRTSIRLKALDVLSLVLSINKHMYEDELINSVVLLHMCHIENDSDVAVRKCAIEILLSLAQTCSPLCFMDLIDIVEKTLNQPLVGKMVSPYPTQDSPEGIPRADESHLTDIKHTISLLTDLFKTKLYAYPPGLCLKVYDMLITHITAHYTEPKDYTSITAGVIRKNIIECLLELRSDVFHRLGICDRSQDSPLQYSPYVTCKQRNESEGSPPRSPVAAGPVMGQSQWFGISHLEYTSAFSVFIQCLENEKDWEVLKCVLENLPVLLQNKTLILSSKRNHVEILCSKLCAMVTDRLLGFPEKLVSVSGKFTRSDFHAYLFPVLAAMVTYHNFLDRNRQRELVKCLQFGMVSKCAKLCVTSLRICTLEMKEVMLRLLPSVLLQLSKISATVSMAIPVLAFLSSIVRLPKMYANFVEDEYMSVFAIALPYTNPFRFSHYTVSLAHHVIAIWFIRCRLPFRKGFVQFIQKGLKANVLQQFEENARQALQDQNQDSSDRHRSGSYSEAALRSRRRMQSGSAIVKRDIQPPVDEKMSQFHRELTETITDVMARYTFGNFSPIPHRSNMAEFLLAGGQSQTWLIGNKLITITTSGGGTKVGNTGLCEKCTAAYHSESKESKTAKRSRRRHQSDLQISRSHSTVVPPPPSSLDDMEVTQRSRDDMSLPLDVSGQDVAVQTGSSLSEHSVLESEPLESLIFGMKASADLKSPVLNLCNCWCTNWAEVYIRAPSGNMSWMMRIENEAGMYSMLDSQVPDITMFFASMGANKRKPDPTQRSRRIESGSVGEEEYESLYAQYFPQAEDKTGGLSAEVEDRPGSFGFSVTRDSEGVPLKTDPPETHQVSQALQIPTKDDSIPRDPSLGSLRRSNSSPSLLSGSSDTLSPRESGSDTAQFGWQEQKGDRLKQGYKSSDSEGGDKSDDNVGKVVAKKVDNKGANSDNTVGGSKKVQFDSCVVDNKDKELEKLTEVREKLQDRTSEKDKSAKVVRMDSSEQVSEPKDEHADGRQAEYHSMLSKQLSPSPASSEASSTQDEIMELPSVRKMRGHTISIVTPAAKLIKATPIQQAGTSTESTRVGVPPSFVFLQLYHSGALNVGNDVPLLVPNNETTERGIKLLDHIYPYETHKIGVIYVGPRQTNCEKEILANQFGSERYARFVQSLGNLIRLRDCNPKRVYLGGLETNGNDGEFTYGWHDETIQLIFHIATLMPNKESDPLSNSKKRHIGNDYVTIVYNDSDEEYKIGVIKGQFNYVNIVVKPLDYESNAVVLQAKEVPFKDKITTDIAEILGHKDTKVISDSNLALLVRQIAVHCNLASMVLQRQQSQPTDPFANNWLERLRSIRRIKNNLMLIDKDQQLHVDQQQSPTKTVEDFTKYC